jgi:hypothetical protein
MSKKIITEKIYNFYKKTDKLYNNFLQKLNVELQNFNFEENKLNYLERIFFNCGTNLFIINHFKNNSEYYFSNFKKNYNSIQLYKTLKFFANHDFNHDYIFLTNKAIKYSKNEKILMISKNLTLYKKLKFSKYINNEICNLIEYINNVDSPILKGSIINLAPDIIFINQFKNKNYINYNVVSGNLFFNFFIDYFNQLIYDVKLRDYKLDLLAKLFIFSHLFFKNENIKIISSWDFYKKYFENKLDKNKDKRLIQAIENDIRIIKLKYSEKLLDLLNEKIDYNLNELKKYNNEEISKLYFIIGDILHEHFN